MRRLLALLTVCLPLAAAPAAEAITLTPLGRTPALGETRAEIAAFDPTTQRVFATNAGDNRLDIYDLSDPSAPALIESVDLSPFGGGPNSVDVSRKGLVAVAVEANDLTATGSVEFFDTDGEHLGSIPAGALPDMLTFAQHDKYLLVANEGEAESGDDDPKGSVTVIRLNKKLDKATVRTATFDGVPTLGPVRVACPDATFAEDAEPEYIAEGPLGTALVTLQENNAVGVLSIPLGRFVAVRGLGFKDHGLARNALDPSDRDNAIAINPWANVFGMYQPDAIAAYTHPEGVQANDKLGRLNVTSTMGDIDGDGDFDRLFPFGGRSMSILGPLGGLVFDTGSELERIAAAEEPSIFNASNEEPAIFDDRSDSKGPEPEGVDVGSVGRETYAFLASERQGGLYAYKLNGPRASFADYVNTRPADLGPEGVRFVPKGDSPTGRALLLVTNEITGTVAAIDVRP